VSEVADAKIQDRSRDVGRAGTRFAVGEKVAPDGNKSTMLLFAGRAYAKKADREQVLRIYRELKGSDPKIADLSF
jgi:hypothetical protein